MTKKLQKPAVDDCRSRKRILKPVVEKKRRDRINQSLAELRNLLLNHTLDPRLQNPKTEKAEILDLTVEYLQKWTSENSLSRDSSHSQRKTHAPVAEPSVPPLFGIESAGFQQCVAQLNSYMHRITPAQRTMLSEGLKHHTETQPPKSDFRQELAEANVTDAACVDSVCISERKEECPKLLLPSHSPFQPLSCSTPCHDFLSPPPSPWFSPSFSTYSVSPPFPSFASHLSFPPSLSPPSSNTSFFSFSPTFAHHAGSPAFYFPPLRSPTHLAPREHSPPTSSCMWRPWS
ncbi:hypothetical protein Q5P01_009292 [Channa striata]|uniref:BHLH domain-containing protein n=1 Tax=Channa striata TaxID=64152 RepID=A0AA88N8S0_CHASR|nr:hypothetical protein Q5P01_009292 [Channa striata]